MKGKLSKTVISFLLLVPFRLTISVVLIKLFTWTSTVNGEDVPLHVVNASVLTSKICYDLAVSIWLLTSMQKVYKGLNKSYQKDLKKNNWEPVDNYWWWWAMIATTIAVAIFIGSDIYLTSELFWHFSK